MLKFTAQILKLGEKSPSTGIVYDKDVMEKIIEEFNKDGIRYGQFVEGDEPFEKENETHKVSNLKIVDDKVFADIVLLDTPNGVKYQDLIKNGEKIATAPRIEVDENGNLVNIISVDITKAEKGAFEGNTLNLIRWDGFKK